MKLHPTQEALLGLIKRYKGDLRLPHTLRSIGKEVGIENQPQVIAHHLDQLRNKGLIREIIPNQRFYKILSGDPVPQVVYVNLYRSTAQCGSDGEFGDDDIVDRVPVSTKTFNISNSSHYFLIKARGKSMEPAIHEGDLVLAHIQQEVNNGQTAVVIHEGKPMVKNVRKIHVDNHMHVFLQSLNKDFPDIDVVGVDSDFRICGLVRGVIRVQ